MGFVSGKSLFRTSSAEEVLVTEQLYKRAPSERGIAAEASVLHALADKLTGPSKDLLVALMEGALHLCNAHTSGLSVIHQREGGEQYFRWDAMAGVLRDRVGGETPLNFSPCGTTLSAGSPQLFKYPGRYFHYFLEVDPQIVEGLVVPVYVNKLPRGTIWIVTHDESRQFTATEARVMSSLASFTAAAIEMMEQKASSPQAAEGLSRRPPVPSTPRRMTN